MGIGGPTGSEILEHKRKMEEQNWEWNDSIDDGEEPVNEKQLQENMRRKRMEDAKKYLERKEKEALRKRREEEKESQRKRREAKILEAKILKAQKLDEEEKRKADEAREREKAQIRRKEIETQRILEEAEEARR